MIQHTIEIRCRASSSALGLVDHYFLAIGSHEYHMGYYTKGSILPVGTTKGYHVVSERRICEECLNGIVNFYNLKEDKRLFAFYPFINCESLSTGVSVQSLFFLACPFVLGLVVSGFLLYAFILILLVIIAFLAWSKFVYSRTVKSVCSHIEREEKQKGEG